MPISVHHTRPRASTVSIPNLSIMAFLLCASIKLELSLLDSIVSMCLVFRNNNITRVNGVKVAIEGSCSPLLLSHSGWIQV